MYTERGPHGMIQVYPLVPEEELAEYAYEVLLHRQIPSMLPIYYRETMGKRELVTDLTGCTRLIDIVKMKREFIDRIHKSLPVFISALDEANALYIPDDMIEIRFEEIYWDNISNQLLWKCLPLTSRMREDHQEGSSRKDGVNDILNSPFFRKILTEEERHRLLDQRNSGGETKARFERSKASSTAIQKEKIDNRRPAALTVLLVSLLMAVLVFSRQIREGNPLQISLIVMMGAVLLLFTMMIRRKEEKKDPPTSTSDVPVHKSAIRSGSDPSSLSRDIYDRIQSFFKFVPRKGLSASREEKLVWAMLEQIADPDSPPAQKVRASVLTADFLMGSDGILCDLKVDSRDVSPKHARIVKRSNCFFLRDEGSDHGTWIGTQRLYKGEEYPLENGDIVRIGSVQLTFNECR